MERFVFTRKIDDLGRVVIPAEMRKYYGLDAYSRVEIIPTENGVLILPNCKKSEKRLNRYLTKRTCKCKFFSFYAWFLRALRASLALCSAKYISSVAREIFVTAFFFVG